ncbi:CubicO group peptidase (beta-lactamase class C family) [Yoonia maricola]|uniref:CubicO group peptidase (Beta-lactamase class C family) n=2 Tax=Yoonia maricola TaxID=420999 RepID=A0A2M8WQB2_9RHOB|nr:CubicO group peptidase (beta-lactamase class C family) [Yoonia maricola]
MRTLVSFRCGSTNGCFRDRFRMQIDKVARITDPARMSDQEICSHWISTSGRQGGNGNDGALFPYWSFSKTAIAICALKLVEAQVLALDALLEDHPFTLRQLLGHTSGLPDYGSLPEYHAAVARADEPWSREQLLDATLAQGMLFAPGEGWSYSNIGYLLTRGLIEQNTGKSLGDTISDMICKPLGLESVTFWDKLEQSAALHWDAATGYDPGWVYHGCLIGSASDASHLLHALFSNDLLRSDTLAEMLNRRSLGGAIPGRPWTEYGYGLGLMSGGISGAGRGVGHSGGGPFSVNAVYHYPDLADPMTIACFTDGTDEGVAEFAVAELANRQ